MKASEVYLEAAILIASQYWSRELNEHFCACGAIELMCPPRAFDFKSAFAEYFMPEERDTEQLWFGDTGIEENRNPRVLALLFMHQIAKDAE